MNTADQSMSLAARIQGVILDVDGVLHPVDGQEELLGSCLSELSRAVVATNAKA